MRKGPLVKVHLGNGRYVKMHREDAIAAGHIDAPQEKAQPQPQTKERPKRQDKQITPQETKAAQPADDFTVIDGVGPATARALEANGVTTFDELRDAGDLDYLSASVNAAIEEWRAEAGG